MNRPQGLGRAILLLTLVSTLGCAIQGRGSSQLTVESPRWIVAGRSLDLRVTQLGWLAGRKVTLAVFVDGKQATRVDTRGTSTSVRVPAAVLPTGIRLVTLKTGTENSTVAVRILPPIVPIGAAAVLGALLGAAFLARRRSRR